MACYSHWCPARSPPQELRPELLRDLLLNCCLNSKAHLIEGGGAGGSVGFIGNRTECALLMLARKWGADFAAVRGDGGLACSEAGLLACVGADAWHHRASWLLPFACRGRAVG